MDRASTRMVGAAALVLLAAVVGPAAQAAKLSKAELFVEINVTDGDAGVQVFLDGEGWRRMKIIDPDGVKIVDTRNRGSVKIQGITEFFFESAEPSFDVQTLEELMALFPEGVYRFEGTTTEGEVLTGKTRLTHNFPEGPMLIAPIGGDPVDPDNAVFMWAPVADPPGSEIVSYEVIVECEEPFPTKTTAIVDAATTSFTAPPEFFAQDDLDECKWEVLAKEESGNQTLNEAEFSVD